MHVYVLHSGFSSQALIHNADKHGILIGDKKELGGAATKLFISLAYLSEDLIVQGFHLIKNIIFQNNKNLQSFLLIIRKHGSMAIRQVLFVFNVVHRTNNLLERHNRVKKKKRSSVVEFMGKKREKECTEGKCLKKNLASNRTRNG
ncbi:uncharacterized protein LOC112589221 [Harpegnathos saltator]|uniref:uncharacterized protein LOC112589221 n=1 Tax=Harpegnathos saltator TaxID=610380 RepID=UPI000DBEE477|nr:uncharacterized protein LOC112589221 [Harpegnathos saltator]